MLSPEAAWNLIEERLPDREDCLGRSEKVHRSEAVGRVLASSVRATVDVPMADVSAMDGYALSGGLAEGAAPVVGTAAAGRPVDIELAPGEAAKIMTGAVVPPGTDRVVPVEQTRDTGAQDSVRISKDVETGAHIRLRGEVVRTGDRLMAAGSLLTSGAISTLASHGISEVDVVQAPTVATVTTGDEVVPPETVPGPGQLRDSNGPFLLAAGRNLVPSLTFRHLGTAIDEHGDLEDRIRSGLGNDVLLLTGGVSMGDFDYVGEILDRLGCSLLFHKVAIQPGKPLLVATYAMGSRRPTWIFGLPGNPASVMVTYWLFVRPVLRRLLGHVDELWHGSLSAELAADLRGSKGRDRFLPAALDFRDGKIYATPRPPVGSHDAGAYGRGNALLRIRPNQPPATAGAPCEVLLVD
ncbi:MAG: molybdopterin molybdotransferase MoeA [Thermoanaerobaculia bacterium]|nr:molybdopterin molybdotransferase MoeA [Thermoanaerobaculia bacterium]